MPWLLPPPGSAGRLTPTVDAVSALRLICPISLPVSYPLIPESLSPLRAPDLRHYRIFRLSPSCSHCWIKRLRSETVTLSFWLESTNA
jgi:hypothetical protein